MLLRDYQINLSQRIYAAWESGAQNVLAVLPTGAGKTVVFARILGDHARAGGAACVIAHRQELVGQISLALAREQVKHRVIGPINVIRYVIQLQMDELGTSYVEPQARVGVAGIRTLISRADQMRGWLSQVTLWTLDEAHHLLRENEWGKGAALMPQARGLGVTATALRADGKGLGRHADGLFDTLVVGPSMREIIQDGFLTDYRIFAPTTVDLDLSAVPVSSSTGDYNGPRLRAAVRKSRIVGDVVTEYQRHASGMLGVTFVPDVAIASDVAAAYVAAGVPAEVVSHKTPDRARTEILRRFKRREILQLVNVDLFGEGFDLPAIQVVSFARPTESYGLYVQQFGRGLRLLLPSGSDMSSRAARLEAVASSEKPTAIIIDHVGNVQRHKLPDTPRVWSLDRRDKRRASKPDDTIPVRICVECTAIYERLLRACPECGHIHKPEGRSAPEQVDGDLQELDAAALAALRGDVEAVDLPAEEYRAQQLAKHARPEWAGAHTKAHVRRQRAQAALRASMGWYGGIGSRRGWDDSEIQRRFYWAFGVDVLSAQALGYSDAIALANRINTVIGGMKDGM